MKVELHKYKNNTASHQYVRVVSDEILYSESEIESRIAMLRTAKAWLKRNSQPPPNPVEEAE